MKEEKILITAIVPIYKVKKDFLVKCINSIKSQKFYNYEVILIFDGENEELLNVVEEIVGNDKRYKIIYRKNRGVSYSRNEGILNAKGEWIVFIDADDWIEEKYFEDISIKLNDNKENNIDFIIYNTNTYYNEEKIEKYNKKKNNPFVIGDIEKVRMYQSVYGIKDKEYQYMETVWSKVYRSSILKNKKIQFEESLKIGEDLIFNFNFWKEANNGFYDNKEMYYYRVSENSTMKSDYDKMIIEYDKLFPFFTTILESLSDDYKENSENFIIRQIERFAFNYFFYDKNKKNEFKEFINKKYYSEAIKKAKYKNVKAEHKIFLFFLKKHIYIGIFLLSKLYCKIKK